MTTGQRARLNSPSTARQLVEKAQRDGSSPPSPPRRETMREKLAAAERQVADLTVKVAELTGGKRFAEYDLKLDSARDIATAIIGNISPRKWNDVKKATDEGYGRRR